MGADYSFEHISNETYASQLIGHNKIFLGSEYICRIVQIPKVEIFYKRCLSIIYLYVSEKYGSPEIL